MKKRQLAKLNTVLHLAVEYGLEVGDWSADPRIAEEADLAKAFFREEIVGNDLEVYRVEPAVWATVDGGIKVAGPVDCICCHKVSKKYFTFDWKRVREDDLAPSKGGRHSWSPQKVCGRRLQDVKHER